MFVKWGFFFRRKVLFSHCLCFFHEPDRVGFFESAAEGTCFFPVFQHQEEGGAGAGHEDGAGEGAEGGGCFFEDGVQREEGVFEVVGKGGEEKGAVFGFQCFHAVFGAVFPAAREGVYGGVGFGGGYGGLGADDEEGKGFPWGKGGEFVADARAAGGAADDAEGHVGAQGGAHGCKGFRGISCFIEGRQSPEDSGGVGGAAAHACFRGDFFGKGHGDAAGNMFFSKEKFRCLHHEVVPACRGAAFHYGEGDGVRLFQGDGVGKGDGVHDGVNVVISVGSFLPYGQGEVDFCIGCFLYHFVLLEKWDFLYYILWWESCPLWAGSFRWRAGKW